MAQLTPVYNSSGKYYFELSDGEENNFFGSESDYSWETNSALSQRVSSHDTVGLSRAKTIGGGVAVAVGIIFVALAVVVYTSLTNHSYAISSAVFGVCMFAGGAYLFLQNDEEQENLEQ